MRKPIYACAASVLAAVTLAACSGSGTSPQGVTTVNPTAGKLQLAVGTANIFGDLGAAGALGGLNVATTFRQAQGGQTAGDSAALVNTPNFTGPMVLPAAATATPDPFGATIPTGPSSGEAGKNIIGSTPQQPTGSSSIPPSTLGVSGNASGLGLEPFNYTSTGTSTNTFGTPASFVPYAVPAYDALAGTSAGDPNAFVPWGGPPAFDPNHNGKGVRDGSALASTILGVSEGLDVFAGVAPRSGAYTLNVSVPTSSSSNGTVTATANLTSTALLPAATPPIPTLDGLGGGTFAVTLPAGVTEAYVQITDLGPPQPATGSAVSCNTSDAKPVYYTLHVTASGPASLPDSDGPGAPGTPVPSLCTSAQNTAANTAPTDGDQFVVQLVGFDYPAFAASYPNSNGNPAPRLAGANGQADITISSQAPFAQTAGATAATRIARAQLRTRRH